MFWQRLEATRVAIAEQARTVVVTLMAVLAFIGAKVRWLFWTILRTSWETLVWAVRGVFIPKVAAPLDVLKHYLLVFFMGMAVLALLWAGKQVVSPPLVITVMDLPSQLKAESWINPELTRTLISEIERMRAVVKGDRDPAFEAVLNPPNVVIKTGEFSLNVQEQILTPLGSLLGYGQGEVRLAVTCYHPGCLRTSDTECRDVVPTPKPGESSPDRQFLCLRLTADIQRGRQFRRLTPRIVLTNDTYALDLQRPMSRVAEAVTSIADPATAALYFYRRVREESDAARSMTNDPEVVADLRSEAFRAAEAADTHDTAAKCWAHTIRAHFAIDRREFSLAEVYLGRASALSILDHLRDRTFPGDCHRLILIAEMELARKLARPGPYPSYPEHLDDIDARRIVAARDRVDRLLGQLGKSAGVLFWFVRSPLDDADLRSALELARSEIGLGWFTRADQCRLLDEGSAPHELDPELSTGKATVQYEVDEKLQQLRLNAWQPIQQSINTLRALSQHQTLPPLTLQAAMDFLERFAGNELCIERVQAVMKRVYLAHPSSAKVTQIFAAVTEAAAMQKSRNLKGPATENDQGNAMLGYARSIYERLVDIGGHNTDVVALSRLAYITEAFYADAGEHGKPRFGPQRDTLAAVTLGWKRYEQQYYPSATRHHAEFLAAFWGSLLFRFYPGLIDADLSPGAQNQEIKDKQQLRSAIAAFAEFRSAVRFFVPAAQVKRLAELPDLSSIGTRISCLCMLSHAVYQNELADFLVDRINKWQNSSAWLNTQNDLTECRKDFIPQREEETYRKTKMAEDTLRSEFEEAERRVKSVNGEAIDIARAELTEVTEKAARELAAAEAALAAADPKTPELEQAVSEARRALARTTARAERRLTAAEGNFRVLQSEKPEYERVFELAKENFSKAREEASSPKYSWKKKNGKLKTAAQACRFPGAWDVE